MRRLGRLSGLGVLFFIGCGGGQTEPKPPPPAPASSALVKEPPPEKADLSPVAAPPELFVVGRLKRPGPLSDTLGKWAGLPMDFRKALDSELHGLESVVAWDAPVEIAVALPANGKRRVRTVVSVGLSSLGGMMNAVRERGLSPERLFPEVFAFAAPNGIHCAVGPALGSTNARLVCGERSTEVEALFPYVTRGLPNENLGNRDLEVELRAEPIKRRFSSEIAGARLFAGFLLRQLEVDSPRLDRALGDATYAVADELVLIVEDTDSIKLGGNLDDANRNVSLELAWKFRSQRSWLASSSAEIARRQAPPPPSLGRLPADATGAGYTVDVTTSKSPAIKAAVLELLDAYLEREKIGKQARERLQHFTATFWNSAQASYVFAKGNLPAEAKASEAAKKLGWRLTRGEFSAIEVGRALEDLDAVFNDREFWKKLAKSLDLDPKAPPKSKILPLKGKGVPAGARALVVTVPPDLTEGLKKRGAKAFKVGAKETVKFVIAVCPDGQNAAVTVITFDEKDAAERLRAYFAEGGKRLGERADLAPLMSSRGLGAQFFTWLSLLDSLQSSGIASAPNHGETPIFSNFTTQAGPPLVVTGSVTIPAAAFADVPGVAMSVGAALDSSEP